HLHEQDLAALDDLLDLVLLARRPAPRLHLFKRVVGADRDDLVVAVSVAVVPGAVVAVMVIIAVFFGVVVAGFLGGHILGDGIGDDRLRHRGRVVALGVVRFGRGGLVVAAVRVIPGIRLVRLAGGRLVGVAGAAAAPAATPAAAV